MNKNCSPNRRHAGAELRAPALCGSVSRRSDDMRATILTGTEKNMVCAIKESIDRTFGEINSDADSNKNA
jgi:hypothetical protein